VGRGALPLTLPGLTTHRKCRYYRCLPTDGEAGLDALLAVLEQDPATLAPPAESLAEAMSNDVNYVESTSPAAPHDGNFT
jgi:hypothetical protein